MLAAVLVQYETHSKRGIVLLISKGRGFRALGYVVREARPSIG